MPQGNGPKKPVAGRRVGGFEIIEKIGQGGMGGVFKAHQLSVGRVVALKILLPRLARDAQFVERFLREARAAARLSHPNIVQAIDAGRAGGYYYFAMEFVEGRTARQLLESGGPLPERRALEIARDIARALACAHDAGIIHRDVKPDNILVARDGTVKLADLGVARQESTADSRLTQTGVAIGTPNYISPEQVRGEKHLDGRSDIYSLGATLHHLLGGTPPFSGGTGAEVLAKHLHQPPPDVREARPAVSPGAAAIVRKAMAKKREDRYATATEMAEDIERVLAGDEPLAAPARPPAPGRRKGLRVLAAVAAVVLLAVLAALFLPARTEPPIERPPAAPPERKQDFLAYMRAWEQKHPGEYEAAIRKYNEFIARTDDLVKKSEAEDAVARLESARRKAADDAFARLAARAGELLRAGKVKAAADVYRDVPERFADLLAARCRSAAERVWQAAADAAFETLKKEADAAARAGDYDRALQVWRRLPGELADRLAPRARAAAETTKKQAETRINGLLEKAARLARDGRPREGLALLDALRDTKYAPLAPQIAALRSTLAAEARNEQEIARRRALAAAKVRLNKFLDDLDAAALRPEDAGRLAEAALADKALEPVAAQVRRAAELGRILARAEREERRMLVARLAKLKGKRVTLGTRDGKTWTGTVKAVTREHVLLDRSYWIGDRKYTRPDATVRIADLSAKTVERFATKWEPKTPEEHLAAAVQALAAKDAQAMAAHLERSGDHELVPRYREKLGILRLGEAEFAAQREWNRRLKPYVDKPRFGAADARAALAALKAYQKKHAKTKFAASVAKTLAVLRSRAEQAICKPGVTWFKNSDHKVHAPRVGRWDDVDLSGDRDIPDGATGLVLEIVNTDPKSAHIGQVRAKGSTDDRLKVSRISRRSQILAFVKLDRKKVFQAFRDDDAVRFFVRGYTGSDVVFFRNAIDKGATRAYKYQSVDCSRDGVPPGSLAIFDISHGGRWSNLNIRWSATDKRAGMTFGGHDLRCHQYVMIPLDRKSSFQIANGGRNSHPLMLVGYVKNLGKWRAVPSDDVATEEGKWAVADLAPYVPREAAVALLVLNYGWDVRNQRCVDVRMAGSSDDQFRYGYQFKTGHGQHGAFVMVGLDRRRRIEYQTDGKNAISLRVVGYIARESSGKGTGDRAPVRPRVSPTSPAP